MDMYIPVSPAELIDKLTILEIKLREITDEVKHMNVQNEYDLLQETLTKKITISGELLESFFSLKQELHSINKRIWDSENDVRKFWNDDVRFIAEAKQSHFYNDERSRIKRAINSLLGSTIIEEKSHPEYEHTV